MNIKSKIITAILTVFIILFVVSGAIALPLVLRAFYYAQIESLGIPEETGYSVEVAKEAFDEMMDYCMGKSEEFGTGELVWSEEGKSHFDDCKNLFNLDKVLIIVSGVGIIICAAAAVLVFAKQSGESPDGERSDSRESARSDSQASAPPDSQLDVTRAENFSKTLLRRAGLLSGVIMIVGGAALGVIAAMDFDDFFVKFHHTFFPGKENWLFDPATDEIIKILPEEFFRNCAILIVSVIVLVSIVLIARGARKTEPNKDRG